MVAPSGLRPFAFPVSLIAVLACALPSCGGAQGAGGIKGTATDPEGRPLSGVVVSVQGLGLSVATSATGRYVLPSIPLGQHVLQFQRIGYAPRQLTVAVTPDTPLTVDAVLDPQPIELGTVLVEGVSRAPDRMIAAPAAVEVMQAATAQTVSITGQAPLALARVPGLDVAEGGVTDFNVNARGFNTMLSRKLLVLQDGRDLATAVWSQIWGALSQPLEDLGRIEVIRGPASALYGANAYNGVIKITTPAARDVVGTKLTFGGGERGTARADLRQAGELFHERLGYRLNVGYTRRDDWARSRTAKDGSDWKAEYAPATATPPTSPGPESLPLIGQTKDPIIGQAAGTPDPLAIVYGSARVDYYSPNGSVVTLEGGTARMDNWVTVTGSARDQSHRIRRPWARLAWDAEGYSVFGWYSGVSLRTVNLTSGKPLYDDEHVFHLEGRANPSFHGDAGRVVVGVSVQNSAVNTYGTGLGQDDDRNDQYYGAFAQLEYGVGHVRMIGAMRWDDSDLFPAQLSPKGALVFSPAEHHGLHLTVGRAFLPPALVNLFGGRPAGPGAVNLTAIEDKLRADPSVGSALANVPRGTLFTNSAAVPESAFGNPRLVPQTVMSYEVGYKGQFGRRVFITLDAYEAHIRNFTTGLLPGVNPAYPLWTAPPEVPAASRAAVDSAVRSALLSGALPPAGKPCGLVCARGLTRLADGASAIVLSYGNVGTVDEWGVELGSSVSLTPTLTVSASYTWYNFAIRQNLVSNVLTSNTPHNKGTVALDYAGRQGIEVSVDARVVAGYPWSTGIWEGYVPPSQTANLFAGYRINPHLRAFANVSDLFDQRRFEVYGGAVIGRCLLAGVTSTF